MTAAAVDQPSPFRLARIQNLIAKYRFGPTTECDQAVFTSIRSPMGEGYRIIARSPGVTRSEAAEITARAPSHGGLCLDTEDAFGFLALPLESGRFCLLFVRHAGTEHTARGGRRVHSLAVLFAREQLDRFGGSPVKMLAAVAKSSPQPLIEDDATLDPMRIAIPACSAGFAEQPKMAALIAELTGRLLSCDPCIVRGASRPLSVLEAAIELTPPSARANMSMLAGVTYAPNRGATLSLVEGDETAIARSILGHGVTWLKSDELPGLEDHESAAWLMLVRDRLTQSRGQTLLDYIRRTEPNATSVEFNRLAGIITDLETASAPDLDPQSRQVLHGRYTTITPCGSLEKDLCDRIVEMTAPPPPPESVQDADADSDT